MIVVSNKVTRCYVIVLSILGLLLFTAAEGQSKKDKNADLAHIKKLFRQINDEKNYKVVTIDNSEEFLGEATDNGGSLKGYFKKDSLKKIVEWVGLSNRVVQSEYYFEKGTLIFVYSTDSRYKVNDSTQELDYAKFGHVVTGRYYFSNGKLIEAVLSDEELKKTKQEDAANLLRSSNEYSKLLNARSR